MSRFGMVHDANMEHAIKVLRAGQSRSQQRQAFMDKALIGGTMAGVGAVGHVLEAGESYRAERDRNAADRAKKDADFNKTFRPELSGEGLVPTWLGEHGEGNASALDQQGPDDVSMSADLAKSNMGLNDAASRTEFGGYRTREGGQEHADIAGSIARDIGTARQGISEGQQMGGMGNSLVRNPAPDMRAPAETYRDPTDDYFGTTGGR